MPSIKEMNHALFRSAFHLNEAAKYLSNVQEFEEEANKLFEMAYEMISIVQPEPEKVSEDKMQSILDEIINFDDEDEKDTDNGN
jgi:type VI protein secretion system component VasF